MKKIRFEWTENRKIIEKTIDLGGEEFILETRVIINNKYFLNFKIHPKENKIKKLECTIQVSDAEKQLQPEFFKFDFQKFLKYPLFFAINPSKYVCVEFYNISIVEKPDLYKIKNLNMNSHYISNGSAALLGNYDEYISNSNNKINIPQDTTQKTVQNEENVLKIKHDPVDEKFSENEPRIKGKYEKMISDAKIEKETAPKNPNFSEQKTNVLTPQVQNNNTENEPKNRENSEKIISSAKIEKATVLKNFNTPQVQNKITEKEDSENIFKSQENPKQLYEFHYCGLINQGATCYMNSFLQALYQTPIFRRKFLQINTDDPVIMSLQNIFRMMRNEKYVSTEDLTKSFGWDRSNVLVQHDAQEFMVVLIDYIQEHIKETPYKNLIKSIFGIETETIIHYQNNDISSIKESQLSLTVQLTDSITKGLELLTEPESMDGNDALEHNGVKMNAIKFLNFKLFPKILMLQLTRFSFNRETYMPIKLMDRCTIVQHINIGKSYTLYCIVTHFGNSADLGHYSTYINALDGNWYYFNDQYVEILNKSPLNEESVANNAYLLFYYLDECKNEIFHE